MAKSLVDYIFRYLATKFLSRDEQDVVGVINRQMSLAEATASGEDSAEGPSSAGSEGSPAESRPLTQATKARDVLEGDASSDVSGSQTDAGVQEEAASEPLPGLMDGLKIVAQNGHAGREERLSAGQPTVIFDTADSPACTDCGSIMVRNGSCYKCLNCGSTSGCS
jgi:ribonucleoside-diphosphate reductase alpha chain